MMIPTVPPPQSIRQRFDRAAQRGVQFGPGKPSVRLARDDIDWTGAKPEDKRDPNGRHQELGFVAYLNPDSKAREFWKTIQCPFCIGITPSIDSMNHSRFTVCGYCKGRGRVSLTADMRLAC